MTDDAALLNAIRFKPAEDVPRLAFADWLDEQGRPEWTAWAEFIRLQVEAARQLPRFGHVYTESCDCLPCRHERRCVRLHDEWGIFWRQRLYGDSRLPGRTEIKCAVPPVTYWKRGFLAWIDGETDGWTVADLPGGVAALFAESTITLATVYLRPSSIGYLSSRRPPDFVLRVTVDWRKAPDHLSVRAVLTPPVIDTTAPPERNVVAAHRTLMGDDSPARVFPAVSAATRDVMKRRRELAPTDPFSLRRSNS